MHGAPRGPGAVRARPGSPPYPASPVRPASPIRPAGPGRPDRPGRTVRTVGPPRQLSADGRGQTSHGRVRPAGHAGQATAAGPVRARQVGRTFFIMLLLGLLGGGLVCLLVVNT